MGLPQLISWLNETAFSVYLRESELAFPLTEAIHLIGLGISVGTVLWIDLRLLGVAMRRERVSDVLARLEPWAISGFVVMFVSGLLLFLGKPASYYTTLAFRIKIMLLPLAGLNVLFFHRKIFPSIGTWDRPGDRLPWAARFVGFASVSLWLVIMVLGRWTAYFADPLYTAGFTR